MKGVCHSLNFSALNKDTLIKWMTVFPEQNSEGSMTTRAGVVFVLGNVRWEKTCRRLTLNIAEK